MHTLTPGPSSVDSKNGPAVRVESRASLKRRRRRRARIAVLAVVAVAGLATAVVMWWTASSADPQAPSPADPIQSSTPTTASAPLAPSSPTTESAAVGPTPTITVNAVGDIAFVSSVQRLMASKGVTAPVDGVAEYLGSADLTVANLETALSERGTAVTGKTFTFRSDPTGSIASLRTAGIDVVSLANNHTRDWGGDALADTFSALDGAGIKWAGAGLDDDRAFAPVLVESNGATVAYLAYSQIGPSNFVATDSRSGAAYSVDVTQMKRAVRRANAQADYVVVSFHWGIEKDYSPSDRQVKFGRAAIDAGADAVLAHHPHVLQGVEFYNGGLIAYSLGNFVFSPGSAAGRDTMILSFTLSPDGIDEAKARAAYIHPDGSTRLAEGSTAGRIASLITETSSGRNTDCTVSSSGHTVTLTKRP